jgi:hypothetical protein
MPHRKHFFHAHGSCFFLIFLCLALFCGAQQVRALDRPAEKENIREQETATEADQETSSPPFFVSFGKIADFFQTSVSNKLFASADWLDSFFQDDRMEIEEDNSSLRIRLSNFYEEGGVYDFKIRARLKLVLPELEERFHFYISSLLEEDDPTRIEPADEFASRNLEEKNVNMSLRYFFKAAKKRNLSFKIGARFDGFTPQAYAGPRFSASDSIHSWVLRFTQNLTYFNSDGWESGSTIDFERPLTKQFFWRTSLKGSWYEDTDGYFYSLNNSLFHSIDNDRALAYHWGTYFETHPCNRLSQTLLQVQFRSRIWREWLFFEVAPQLTFPEDHDFDAVSGIKVSLEGIFGKQPGSK